MHGSKQKPAYRSRPVHLFRARLLADVKGAIDKLAEAIEHVAEQTRTKPLIGDLMHLDHPNSSPHTIQSDLKHTERDLIRPDHLNI